MKKLVMLTVSLFLMSTSVEAQFFKKLKEKVEKKVENAVIDNVSDKAADEANRSLESVWATNMEKMPIAMGGAGVDPDSIPEDYAFNWEYTLSMETNAGNTEMTYFLKENMPYVGLKVKDAQQMFMVMDNKNKMMVMFLDAGENKMLSATEFNPEMTEASEEEPFEQAKFQKVPPKEILGYTCQGYRTETEEHRYTFYVTEEAGISFTDLFRSNNAEAPSGFNPEWLKEGNGLMMEMFMEDKNDPARNVKMSCVSIEEKDFRISKNDYQGF